MWLQLHSPYGGSHGHPDVFLAIVGDCGLAYMSCALHIRQRSYYQVKTERLDWVVKSYFCGIAADNAPRDIIYLLTSIRA